MKGKSQMKNIGKYNGISCYSCTYNEWKDCYDKGQDNGKQIFIIDGTMVCKNKIIGYYDGKHVKDKYDEQPYYIDNGDVMEFNKQKQATVTADNKFVEEVKTSSSTGTTYEEVVAKEIRFSDYSKIVDDFFAKLEV